MQKTSYSLYDGVKHSVLGYGNVLNQNPDEAGKILIRFEDIIQGIDQTDIWLHPSELELAATDMNHRIIKVGDMILYHVPSSYSSYIGQGVVEYIKEGKSPKGYGKTLRIGIREDKNGMIKSHAHARQCIVINQPVIQPRFA